MGNTLDAKPGERASSSMAQQPPVRQGGLLIAETSQPHSETPQSVGLFWASDPPDTETST